MNNSSIEEKHLRVYSVEVLQRGSLIALHQVEAPDALTAINQVEPRYGEPVVIEETDVDDEEGQKHHFLLARNWHGYTFQARLVKSI